MPAGTMQAISTGAALGAEVTGVDLRHIDASVFAELRRVWLDSEVVLLRDQQLSDAELVAFSQRIGTLEQAPIQENGRRFVPGHAEIYVVSNVIEDGVAIGSLGSGEAAWHTDMSYLPEPPMASVLYALETPSSGGETGFTTMTGAYAALPDALKERIVGLRVKHDGTYNSGGYLRAGVTPTDNPRTSPGTLHPLVCLHPDTGKNGLYLGRRRNAYIDGLSVEASDTLLDEIWANATDEALTWYHRWRPGDLVMWDNRTTMHRRNAFDAGTRRVMHRTQIKGTTRPSSARA